MANALYENWINNILGNGTHTNVALHGHAALKCVLVEETGSGVPNLTTDQDEADLGTLATDYIDPDAVCGSVVAGNTTIGATTYGGFDHTIVTWTAVAASVTYESISYYDDTSTVNTTNPLICNIDTATGLSPVTSNGGDITWNPHADGVFQLTTT